MVKYWLKEFWMFGMKNLRSCIFAGSFFFILAISNYLPLFGLARYDFLFLSALFIQIILIWTNLETKDEAKMIVLFHLIGLCLELFKTNPHIGSWSYPEPGFFKIGTVPLYSGFMYAAVGSYLAQAWRQFRIRLENYPSYKISIPLVILIYVNFFTHHIPGVPDMRFVLIALVVLLFFRTNVYFIVTRDERSMKLPLSFFLIGFFIWIAENIATFYGAWTYPGQEAVWHMVSLGKISSWFLLVIISFILVADLKAIRKKYQDGEFKSLSSS